MLSSFTVVKECVECVYVTAQIASSVLHCAVRSNEKVRYPCLCLWCSAKELHEIKVLQLYTVLM